MKTLFTIAFIAACVTGFGQGAKFKSRKVTQHYKDSSMSFMESLEWKFEFEWRRNFPLICDAEYIITYNRNRLFSIAKKSDTVLIAPSRADSLFLRARVIMVAGRTFREQ
jgi:hypothetical protein